MIKTCCQQKSKSEIVINEKIQEYVSVTWQVSRDEVFEQKKEGWFRFSRSNQNGGGACQDENGDGDCECHLEPF